VLQLNMGLVRYGDEVDHGAAWGTGRLWLTMGGNRRQGRCSVGHGIPGPGDGLD
jgi:hypothetical protein